MIIKMRVFGVIGNVNGERIPIPNFDNFAANFVVFVEFEMADQRVDAFPGLCVGAGLRRLD